MVLGIMQLQVVCCLERDVAETTVMMEFLAVLEVSFQSVSRREVFVACIAVRVNIGDEVVIFQSLCIREVCEAHWTVVMRWVWWCRGGLQMLHQLVRFGKIQVAPFAVEVIRAWLEVIDLLLLRIERFVAFATVDVEMAFLTVLNQGGSIPVVHATEFTPVVIVTCLVVHLQSFLRGMWYLAFVTVVRVNVV
jgi:hypothetical protein